MAEGLEALHCTLSAQAALSAASSGFMRLRNVVGKSPILRKYKRNMT